MTLRYIPTSFPNPTVADIDARLDDICVNEGVSIPWAIESGSRAWGFPSPDSDFDCRFVFVRPIEQHLSPWLRRDVIETPLVGELDVNGWDLAKAFHLLLKGNAVIIEWLRSPIIYRGERWFRDELLGFATRLADRDLIAKHYLHLGERQRRVYFADGTNVPQKKIFYALRPAATLRWLRHHPGAAIAPMHFPTLMSECDPPAELASLVAELIERKSVTRELGSEPLPAAIAAFIDNEFELARTSFASRAEPASADARSQAKKLYQKLVHRAFATAPS
ncbi:DNA polymerase beta superfamily protein [Candidatus Viadribacter manganicus]|uniref:Nucleotidyltransferase n=1 Tax=Candidatus Viadribacter manganicus TaxID=1759059 RepID=A0A1B1AHM4_9PROT|nr:nucleotidyltransferase domain-containing protein [Candidatus Viadribacter manganicus]ANP46057.1 nucleotidyltransferase [Candidatus Viadribacter manganicus]